MLNDFHTIGNFLSRHILLWKEDLSEKISGHIILFYAEHVYEHVITSLLEKTKKPIIFYSETQPDEKWLRFSSRIPNLFYAQGGIFDLTHLRNCGVEKAFHICIFNSEALSTLEANTAECLLLANLLDDYFNVNFTIEVNDQNEMKFLGSKPKKNVANLGFQFYPKYIAGELSVLNVMDSLISFTSTNPTSLDIFIHMFVFNENRRNGDNNSEWETQNVNLNIFENLQIKTIKCPEYYYNKIYSELVFDFCKLTPSVIPIGLATYRYTHFGKEKTSAIKRKRNHTFNLNYSNILEEEMNMNVLPGQLTLTNPLPTTILNENDQIIVIGNCINSGNSEILPPSPTYFNQSREIKKGSNAELEEIPDFMPEESRTKLLNLLQLTLSGKRPIIKKIEEKNEMIKNLMYEIERKKNDYVRILGKTIH